MVRGSGNDVVWFEGVGMVVCRVSGDGGVWFEGVDMVLVV